MLNNRRKFLKDSICLSLSIGCLDIISTADAQEIKNYSKLNPRKAHSKTLKISGKVYDKTQTPLRNLIIEIWHSNTKEYTDKFEYHGRLQTNSQGEYSFLTDFPKKHFEEGFYKMRRIFFKIINNDQELSTTLYFGELGKAFIDSSHVSSTLEEFRAELPKTDTKNDMFSQIQFNIFF